MSTFPNAPRFVKGALLGVDPANPLASVIAFQYNPTRMTRRVAARGMGGEEGDRAEAFRLTGPPRETISLTIEIDATDEVDGLNKGALVTGVSPTLAALENLLYPKNQTIIENELLMARGNLEIVPPEAPPTLFVWGATRVLPVRLTDFTITEESYDARLNPIRASVELSLLVLSYNDLPPSHKGYQLFRAHHIAKEALATSNVFNSIDNVGGGLNIL